MRHTSLKKLDLFKPSVFLSVGLIGLSLPTSSAALPTVNPCPGIYYEEPHNSIRIVPTGCRPNAATQFQQGNQTIVPSTTSTVEPTFTPSGTQQIPIANVTPSQGEISMQLRNNMETMVTYQALGQTSPRSLNGGQEVFLQNLPVPMTLTVYRSDGGLVRMVSMPNQKEGVLGISLTEANGLSDSQLNIRVQSQGQVYAY